MRSGRDQDCLVCAITSHGTKNDLICCRDSAIFLNTIYAHFHPDNCPELAGKPKMFLITVSLFSWFFTEF